MDIEEVRKAAERVLWKDRSHEDYWQQDDHDEYALASFVIAELARRDAEAAERALPITEEWLRSIGAIIDAEDGVVEFCWLPGELVILSGGLLLWTVDCVEVGKIATRGQLLDVHGVIARS